MIVLMKIGPLKHGRTLPSFLQSAIAGFVFGEGKAPEAMHWGVPSTDEDDTLLVIRSQE
jgi:hypothetical protein